MRARSLITLLAVLAALLTAPITTAGAGAAAHHGWKLVDYDQSACFSPNVTSTWYGIWLRGTWKHPVQIGAEGLPAGGSYSTSDAPIPPGSSTGVYSLAYVEVTIPASTPIGTYGASLWAQSGKVKHTVPITLVVKARCGY
jgi:hypothetical protein